MWKTIVWLTNGKKSEDVDSFLTDAQGNTKVHSAIGNYLEVFNEKDVGKDDAKIEERKSGYKTMVSDYYSLVTEFYEYGWGKSFHFSMRYNFETFDEGTRRHEYYLASRLGLKPGMNCIDLGCGVGGPMRNIARFTGCNVTGVTICKYQVDRANALNVELGLSKQCRAEFGDFMQLGSERVGKFDAAYGVEATCHAPDRVKCFTEVYNSLKPGSYFAVYEWCMTPKYDPTNEYHRLVKHEIEKGDGLPDLTSQEQVIKAFEGAGFNVLDHFDMAAEYATHDGIVPWYATIQGGASLSQLKHTRFGRFLTQKMVDVFEVAGVAPKGTSETHMMLCKAAEYLAKGGELGIFTPMYFVLAQKPVA